ncbi:MAG: hypothetical protein GXP55_04390 [Deltaproteobacteria bacterium]|nr:hypothetical protein [Deltaproteobacteria bacterium]
MTRFENSSPLFAACLLLLACSGARRPESTASASPTGGAVVVGAEIPQRGSNAADSRQPSEVTPSDQVGVAPATAEPSDAAANEHVSETAEDDENAEAEAVEAAVPTSADHTSTPCPWGRTRFRLDRQVVDGVERESRTSRRRRRRSWNMRPGQVLRLERTLRNVSAQPIPITAQMAAAYRSGFSPRGRGVFGSELVEMQVAGDVTAGQVLMPGAMIRVCGEFRVPDAPLYAFPGDGRRIDYYFNDFWGGVEVRYPPERGSARESTSWGGMVRVILVRGASLRDICREEHLRIALGLQLRSGGGAISPPAAVDDDGRRGRSVPYQYVQVPRDTSVAEAVERLARRPDVVSASAVSRGDPGAEGCSEYAPCGAGQSCCYLCGMAGCPMTCLAGPSCPTGMP